MGFIIILIFGNIWFADALLAVPPPGWVVDGLLLGMLTAMTGGFGLVGLAVIERLSGRRDEHDLDET